MLPASLLTPARAATKDDIRAHFSSLGTGEIIDIKVMNGFGFIEYKDAMDARDAVPGMLSRRLPFSSNG